MSKALINKTRIRKLGALRMHTSISHMPLSQRASFSICHMGVLTSSQGWVSERTLRKGLAYCEYSTNTSESLNAGYCYCAARDNQYNILLHGSEMRNPERIGGQGGVPA